jgi:hypothetical protein
MIGKEGVSVDTELTPPAEHASTHLATYPHPDHPWSAVKEVPTRSCWSNSLGGPTPRSGGVFLVGRAGDLGASSTGSDPNKPADTPTSVVLIMTCRPPPNLFLADRVT